MALKDFLLHYNTHSIFCWSKYQQSNR